MSITFECGGCGKGIEAPDSAAGKRGKCPYCGRSNDIPVPGDDDLFELAPLDEQEELRRRQEIQRLLERERDLLTDSAEPDGPSLEHRDSVDTADLHRFVVDYCRDMSAGQLQRARTHVRKLRTFRGLGKEAVEDFQTGKVTDPSLADIPARVLAGFLKSLASEME